MNKFKTLDKYRINGYVKILTIAFSLSFTPIVLSGEFVEVQGGVLPSQSEFYGQMVPTFYIGRYEVTWGEWKAVRDWAVGQGYDIGSVGGTYPSGAGDNFPVCFVSWYDALKWCNAKSQKEGLVPVYSFNGTTYKMGQIEPTQSTSANGYRLPKEAEWEWAARGGLKTHGYTYSGSNDSNAVAWTKENSSYQSKAVGTKAGNELGIYDMSGNVWEWCWDVFVDDTSYRWFRGGSWRDQPIHGEVSHRTDPNLPEDRGNYDGFRLASSVKPPTPTVAPSSSPSGGGAGSAATKKSKKSGKSSAKKPRRGSSNKSSASKPAGGKKTCGPTPEGQTMGDAYRKRGIHRASVPALP